MPSSFPESALPWRFGLRSLLFLALVVQLGCAEGPAEETGVAEEAARALPCSSVAPVPRDQRGTPHRRDRATPCADAEDHAATIAHIDAELEAASPEGLGEE